MDGSGKLNRLFAAGKPNPTYLALSADGQFLYTVNELKEYHEEASSAVSAYRVDPDSGELTLLSRRMTGGMDACCLSVSPNGKYVMIANFSGGSFALFPVLPDGSLSTPSCFVQHYGHSANPTRQTSPHVHQITADPAGERILVADLGTDQLSVYGIDLGLRCVSPNARLRSVLSPAKGPRQFVFDTSGRTIYLVTELATRFACFDSTKKTGKIKLLQTLPTLPNEVRRGQHLRLLQAASGWKAFVRFQPGHDSIASYRVPRTERSPRCASRKRAEKPRAISTITPDGKLPAFGVPGLQRADSLLHRPRKRAAHGKSSARPATLPHAVLFYDYE